MTTTPALHAHLSELARWYRNVAVQVREADTASAQRVAELIAARVDDIEAALRDGHSPRALATMRGMRGLLTKPNTGSMLSLVRYPELEAEAGRLHVAFGQHLSELSAQVSTTPIDHARLDELLAESRERFRAERAAAVEDGARSSSA